MIPLIYRENVTESELLEEEFRECGPCAAKPGSPQLCEACLQNRTLISHLQKSVRTTLKNRLKEAFKGLVFGFWEGR